ncbi:ABC transporter permease [Candidatus Fermentibacteria bacterium]|nr:ABC transporter permease [Candidatus Fermentibacteria bacterium]
MSPSWLVVARREYLCRVRSVSFRIGTVAGPLVLAAIVGLPQLSSRSASPSGFTVMVIDSIGIMGPQDQSVLKVEGMEPVRLVYSPPDLPYSTLTSLVQTHALDGAMVIAQNGEEAELMSASSMNLTDEVRLHAALRELLFEASVRRRGEAMGLDSLRARSLATRVAWRTVRVQTANPWGAAGLALFMAMLLYVTLLTYGLATMRAVVEEKSGRIVEMLLSSARPVDLLAGKICGVASVGLTQYVIWFLIAALLSSVVSLRSPAPYPLPPWSLGLAVACIGYFLLGYILFAALYAMVAGMVNSTADAQHLHLPVTALLVAPIILVWLVIASPTSATARVLSLVPLFAPVLMVARIAVGAAAAIEVALSIVGLMLFIVASLWIASRIYRAGILMRGSPPSPREVLQWIRDT